MLLAESEWFKSAIEALDLPPGTKVLNFGSHKVSVVRYQGYIDENIYRPVARKQWELLNFDLFPGEAVDISGDIMQDDVFAALVEREFGAIFLFNVLEHLTDHASICSRIGKSPPKADYILVTVVRTNA